jgi:hypothetical protein
MKRKRSSQFALLKTLPGVHLTIPLVACPSIVLFPYAYSTYTPGSCYTPQQQNGRSVPMSTVHSIASSGLAVRSTRRKQAFSCFSCDALLTGDLPPIIPKYGQWCGACYACFAQHKSTCNVCNHVPTFEELQNDLRCKRCLGGTWLKNKNL